MKFKIGQKVVINYNYNYTEPVKYRYAIGKVVEINYEYIYPIRVYFNDLNSRIFFYEHELDDAQFQIDLEEVLK